MTRDTGAAAERSSRTRGRAKLAGERRPLARPDEEIVDQGLGFDLLTLLDRRQALRALGVTIGSLGLAACVGGPGGGSTSSASRSASTAPGSSPSGAAGREIAEETAGPFPGDGSNGPDVLDLSGVVRSDIRASFAGSSAVAQGVPMTLELTVQNVARAAAPFAGAAVYVWHCDREGRYSLYSEGARDQNYLRGVQIADSSGKVRFTSIFPACYPGRWPHVHFEVYPDRGSIADAGSALATSQVALPEGACRQVYGQQGYEVSLRNLSKVSLAGDSVFGDDIAATELATVTGDAGRGYSVALRVGVRA